MARYVFGWGNEAAVECPEMDAFMEAFEALCRKYGIGFEVASWDEGGGYLVPTQFEGADFGDFTRHLDKYSGGVPWLDAAKQRYEIVRKRISEERKELADREREAKERRDYERLKSKFA